MISTSFDLSSSDSRGGGSPARRAVVRWAWRLFRREWRQQVVVLALLAVVVAAAVAGMSAVYNVVPARAQATFGSAGYRLEIDGSDPAALEAGVDAARSWFGTLDVIGRRELQLPGLSDAVELRMQDPTGVYGAAVLSLVDGRYPSDAHEVAVTDVIAADLRLGIGDGLELDGTQHRVVGVVENPHDLDDEFVLQPPEPPYPTRSASSSAGAPIGSKRSWSRGRRGSTRSRSEAAATASPP